MTVDQNWGLQIHDDSDIAAAWEAAGLEERDNQNWGLQIHDEKPAAGKTAGLVIRQHHEED
jgi:hypothetical protein